MPPNVDGTTPDSRRYHAQARMETVLAAPGEGWRWWIIKWSIAY
jgi:hypothetical protein